MILYFIQVVAFQLLFLVSYDLVLKKETFFNWNRTYLIFSSLISFLLPFIKIESFQNAVPQEYIILLPEIVLTPEIAVETIAPSWNWYVIIGIVVSSLLFLYKIFQLVRLKLKGIIVHKGHFKIIKISNSTAAFSIFNYVFLGEDIEEAKLEDILSHELVHIREKHSIDLLYFELLRILFWFNPLVYIYQKRISELHEYIADATVVKENNKSDYYEKLLSEVFQTQHFSFTNQFFKHSLIKKRIIMLTKQKSREILKLKYLVLIPVLLLSLLYTSCDETTIADTEDEVEVVDSEAKTEMIKDFMRELNKLNSNLEKNQILSQAQFQEQKELLAKIGELMSDDENYKSSLRSNGTWTYEDYVGARKKSIAEDSDYSILEKEAISFKVLDKSPVFPGSTYEGSLDAMKKSFSQSIGMFVNKNFNTELAEALGLVGIQRIFAKFIIDENGDVTSIKVRAPHKDLETEVERVLNLVPKLTPGEKDGKAVKINFVLPIAFKIQE